MWLSRGPDTKFKKALLKLVSPHGLMLLIWLVPVVLGYGSFTCADFLFSRELAARMEEINAKNIDMARLLGENVNHTFTQADSILLFMKTAINAHGVIDPAEQELLKSFRNKGAIIQIAVADARGNVLFSAVPLAAPLNIADREHFQAHVKVDTGKVFIASPRVTEATATAAIFLSRRLNDANGNFAGVVTIGLDPDYFADEFRVSDIGPGRSIVLLRTDGAFLARVPSVQVPGLLTYFKTHPVISYIKKGITAGVHEAPGLEGVSRLGAFRVLPDYPVVVMVGYPKETALAAVVSRHEVYRSWAAAFSALLFSACFALWWLMRRHHRTNLALSQEQQRAVQYLSQMEKQKVEVELARLDRLSIIGELAASIGHEVRNPLTTVRGYLQLFQRKTEYSPNSQQFTLMIDELDRANAIITEFLSLAKNKRLDLAPVTLNGIIANLAPLLQADAIREGKVVLFELVDSPPIFVDANEIRQLVLNLVRNALDAMKSGGTVTISITSDRDGVVLSVQDTGSGIPPEIYQNLGAPFQTTKENGTGLGLTVCYKIAERHKAMIEVKTGSEGTSFAIRFPHLSTGKGPEQATLPGTMP